MNSFLRKTTWISLVAFFVAIGFSVQAEDKIDVEYKVGNNLNGKDIFSESNIYPGWSESKTIRVENDSEVDETDLYFDFDLDSGPELAKELKIYVIRKSDDSYRIGGFGDRYDLEDADDQGDLFVDRLGPGEGNQYKVKVKFDKDAGNEFQNLRTRFNIDFQIESLGDDDRTVTEILADQGRVVTGEAPEDETEEEPEEVQGAIIEEIGNGGKVAGEETTCQSWPLWLWIVALILFTILSFISTKNTEEKKAKSHFFWQLIAVGLMVALWYWFNKCSYYKWFPISVIIIGILNHGFYHKFKKRKKVVEAEQE